MSYCVVVVNDSPMKIIMKILIDNYFFSLDAEYKSRINYESNWPKGLIVRISRARI